LGRASTKHDANNWGLSHPCDGDGRDTLQLQRAKAACREKRRSCAEQHPDALAPQFLVLWTGYDQRSLGTNLQNFASIRMTLSDWIVGLFVSAVKRVGRPQDRLEVINCLPIRVCV